MLAYSAIAFPAVVTVFAACEYNDTHIAAMASAMSMLAIISRLNCAFN